MLTDSALNAFNAQNDKVNMTGLHVYWPFTASNGLWHFHSHICNSPQ